MGSLGKSGGKGGRVEEEKVLVLEEEVTVEEEEVAEDSWLRRWL